MTDSYVIDGVTITPQGGGVYDLSHPALDGIVTERGKDKAEKRAKEIAQNFAEAELLAGQMAPQGDLPELETVPVPAAPEADPRDAQLAAMADQIKALTEMVTRSVVTNGAAPVAEPAVTGAVPSQYVGILSKAQKAALEEMGIKSTDIILEEDETIPPTGLFVSVNGRAYMISPGEPVTVPNFVLEVLDNAVMSTPVVDPKSQKVMHYRDRSKYPYKRL